MSTTKTAQPTKSPPTPTMTAPAGHNNSGTSHVTSVTHQAFAGAGDNSLNGQGTHATQTRTAVEGQDSPQATLESAPTVDSPAGSKTGRDQRHVDTHQMSVPAPSIPGAQKAHEAQPIIRTGEQTPPAATRVADPAA